MNQKVKIKKKKDYIIWREDLSSFILVFVECAKQAHTYYFLRGKLKKGDVDILLSPWTNVWPEIPKEESVLLVMKVSLVPQVTCVD